ncbi:hypothetical protein [Halopiger goleimassiliensis]|uniref:hypothetical protein n=1 Tax=Halopiger goleimassiliensis TaxID=1293048 RepID=UPI000677C35A|nr:hypothetical protein [Halopiger goleimassiliensis]
MDLESVLQAPFEEAPNRSFEAVLLVGVVLFVAVTVLGRSWATMVIVGAYLCFLPLYVGYRTHRRVQEGDGPGGRDRRTDANGESNSGASVESEPDATDGGD